MPLDAFAVLKNLSKTEFLISTSPAKGSYNTALVHLLSRSTRAVTKPSETESMPNNHSTCSQRENALTWTVFITLVMLTTTADLFTKSLAFKNLGMPGTNSGWPVINNMLWFRTSLNEGALFWAWSRYGMVLY